MDTFMLVDNKFIIEYLPYAKDIEIRVYLYGLYLCSNPAEPNTLDDMTRALDISEDNVLEIYSYWAECGLVKILSTSPLEVQYLSMKRGNQPPRKFKAEKYSDFNLQLQGLFPNRQILPNEYNEYYMFLEVYKIEQNALIMIAQYCIHQKGAAVRYPYIIAVAKDWANNGVKTVADVEEKLLEYEAQTDSMRQLLKALGRKGGADLEEQQMLLKWTKNWGYELNAVIFAAKLLKNKTFKRLDTQLDDYYRKNIFTEPEMKDYEEHCTKLRELAIKINKTIGVFYESLDHIIEVYTIPWTEKGFDEEALSAIAHYCFLGGVKTLDGVNSYVNFYFKKGLLTKESIDQFIAIQLANDEVIKKIIETAGRIRAVTNNDRESYKLWNITWGFANEIILYAASLCALKTYPIPAITQLLQSWNSQNVKTIDQAKALDGNSTQYAKPTSQSFVSRDYTKSDLTSIFADNDIFSNDK
ncbi:MAG TPA: DnaD domain protein [Clostridia bacterium]|nr:DnaD domain protein [Clostridia bacterium]